MLSKIIRKSEHFRKQQELNEWLMANTGKCGCGATEFNEEINKLLSPSPNSVTFVVEEEEKELKEFTGEEKVCK